MDIENNLNPGPRIPVLNASPDGVFANSRARILAFVHDDLDGAVSGIVLKTVYQNRRTKIFRANYRPSPLYSEMVHKIRSFGSFCDAIIFADYCPFKDDVEVYEALKKVNKPFLVIDHHPKALEHPDVPNGTFVIDTRQCGALNCMDYFSGMANLDALKTLCEVTNDHDMWLRRMIPVSDRLNSLMHLLGFKEFMRKYADGMPGYSLKKNDIARMANYDIEVDRYLEKCVQGPLPFNGYYVECSKYNSDIVLRLRDKYDWIVLRNPNEIRKGMTKLSFRTRRTDVDLGKVLASYNMGGGGHPGAGGQIVETRVVPMFILDVAVKAFGKEGDYGI
jgi:oligoribonuclease NrnB/cAMP/cGMP phosphodiesterase (DHH superfamily)